jgi:probable selenium-dependent hydroxylase accessory protein YqeC
MRRRDGSVYSGTIRRKGKKMWYELLMSLNSPKVMTLIGGGGKTGLMYFLVELWKAKGGMALAATTTKVSAATRPGHHFICLDDPDRADAIALAAKIPGVVTLVSGEDTECPQKMRGIPAEWVDRLARCNPDVLFVVEGDGSAGRSLKGYREYEPVIPASSQIVIPIIGMDVIGMPLTAEYVHRPEIVCGLTGEPINATVTIGLAYKLLLHSLGYLHNCPVHCRIVPFLNKVESKDARERAKELADMILSQCRGRVGEVAAGSLYRQEFFWYRRSDR